MNIIKSFIKLVYIFVKPKLCMLETWYPNLAIVNNKYYIADCMITDYAYPFFTYAASLLDGAKREYKKFLSQRKF